MSIYYNKEKQTFHLTNGSVSYIMKVLRNGQLGNLYFGKAVADREDFDYLLEPAYRSMASYAYEGDMSFSLEHIRQEFPSYGTGDFRHPAVQIREENGCSISDLVYESHEVLDGKPPLKGLPATYCEAKEEAQTLLLTLRDPLTGVKAILAYTLFADRPVIARSVRFVNEGESSIYLDTAMSLCLDLPDADYEWIQFSGAWSRERSPILRPLTQGTISVESTRGNSSHNHNPFVILKRPSTDEHQGEAIGFALVYSGNFLAQAEVDTWNVTRFTMGIDPFGFHWKCEPGEEFQTPEALMVYSQGGLNAMSQTIHKLYSRRLARGVWRDRPRPILINNWEATYFDISEEKVLSIARKAKEQGIEMFVLDDGWYGDRENDKAGLGDWNRIRNCLPGGILSLSEKVEALGMKFGLWFEPEMVNKDSDLYRTHPDWAFQVDGRRMTHCRNQFVLDYGRPEVVDYIHGVMADVLGNAKISYVKWDMNRSITEAFSATLPADRQGEVFHRYILGVYDLYERLTTEFPEILFESCSSGGGRMDPGMLYYAPQCWQSDDTDAIERIRIQYGSSYGYPLSSFGAHVSAVPNHQTFRITPIDTRANVAYFGCFGYELDLNKLSEEELQHVRRQVAFMKEHRKLLQYGTFYRLQSPFESDRIAAWMVVSEDKRTAIVGYYKILNEVNGPFRRVHLSGLDENLTYRVNGERAFGGDELMNVGLVTTDSAAGECREGMKPSCDFDSRLYVLKATDHK